MIWDPFDPLPYLTHVSIGTLGLIGAIVALRSAKGSPTHRRAGWVFAVAATVAAVSALYLNLNGAGLLVWTSTLMTLSLVAGGVLASRRRSVLVVLGEFVAMAVMAMVTLNLWANVVSWLIQGVPASDLQTELLYGLFPLGFLIFDFRHIVRRRSSDRPVIFRHLSRLAFAFAIAVHAPIVSFSDDLGLNALLAFFGPFLIWPMVLWAFRRMRPGSVAAPSPTA